MCANIMAAIKTSITSANDVKQKKKKIFKKFLPFKQSVYNVAFLRNAGLLYSTACFKNKTNANSNYISNRATHFVRAHMRRPSNNYSVYLLTKYIPTYIYTSQKHCFRYNCFIFSAFFNKN